LKSSQRISLPGQLAVWRLRTDGSRNRSRVEMLSRSPWGPERAKTWPEVHQQRWHPLPSLCALLRRCGLQVCGVHDLRPAAPWVLR
jgi:hypothetical protein